MWLVLVSVTLLVLGGNVGKLAHEAEAAGIVFEAGPFAQPKSLEETGLPLDATRAAIPPDNPQTPEKIALGKRLFFEPRLCADGTIACSTCMTPNELSPMVDPSRSALRALSANETRQPS